MSCQHDEEDWVLRDGVLVCRECTRPHEEVAYPWPAPVLTQDEDTKVSDLLHDLEEVVASFEVRGMKEAAEALRTALATIHLLHGRARSNTPVYTPVVRRPRG